MVLKCRHGKEEGRSHALLHRLSEGQRTHRQGQVPVTENRYVLRHAQWITLLQQLRPEARLLANSHL